MDVNLILGMAVLMVAVAGSFLYMLLGRRKSWKPQDGMEWAGSILSLALMVAAVALIVVALKASAVGGGAVMAADRMAQPSEIIDMAIEVPAGDFVFKKISDGSEASLESLRGKVLLVNFWGTWCPPCLAEIPELNRLQRRYEDKGLVVLSISDEDADMLAEFGDRFPLETMSVQIPPGLDLPSPFKGAMYTRPQTFVVDREGIVHRHIIGRRSYDIFERFVQPYL